MVCQRKVCGIEWNEDEWNVIIAVVIDVPLDLSFHCYVCDCRFLTGMFSTCFIRQESINPQFLTLEQLLFSIN